MEVHDALILICKGCWEAGNAKKKTEEALPTVSENLKKQAGPQSRNWVGKKIYFDTSCQQSKAYVDELMSHKPQASIGDIW